MLSDYPKAMVPLLAHRWQAASDAQRMQFMTLVRSVSISDEDRAAWLTIISQAMPDACVYDDFGALMKQGEHEAPVAHALALVLQDNPALLTEHIWCEGCSRSCEALIGTSRRGWPGRWLSVRRRGSLG